MATIASLREELATETTQLVRDIYSLGGREPDEQKVSTVMEILSWGHGESYTVILDRGIRAVSYLLSNEQATSRELLKVTEMRGEHPIHNMHHLGLLGPLQCNVIVPVGNYDNNDPIQCIYGLDSKKMGEEYIELATRLRNQLESGLYSGLVPK